MLKKKLEFRETSEMSWKNEFKTFWTVEGMGHLCVSSVHVPETGVNETMIFKCDENGNIESYSELYTHFSYLSTEEGHETVLNDWDKVRNL